MKNLKEVLETTNAKIVISSTRRIHKESNNFLWSQLIKNFKKYSINKEIIDITPIEDTSNILSKNKNKEIEKWLKINQNLNIKNFIILDDELNM
jgi:hypothetical protein